jgi:hypothetical protein
VDFLHQFCRRVVSKEDKTLPWQAFRLLFCAALRVNGRHFPQDGIRPSGKNALDLIRGAVSDCNRMDR